MFRSYGAVKENKKVSEFFPARFDCFRNAVWLCFNLVKLVSIFNFCTQLPNNICLCCSVTWLCCVAFYVFSSISDRPWNANEVVGAIA